MGADDDIDEDVLMGVAFTMVEDDDVMVLEIIVGVTCGGVGGGKLFLCLFLTLSPRDVKDSNDVGE